ncbi:hypothetical protein YYC_05529 [Plasmodium yoelii 17X]|uniref:YIR protein n=1 Tax=Plasmodium yoelii 17X TaxID=1323249 RepID=V7PBX1_PLAYE|nr:hypothetical protein YYC_05529 [Plasmodium yoelii 17X]
MNKEVCNNFIYVTTNFPDKLIGGDYKIVNDEHLKNYCTSGCDGDLDKINAGCLYFFKEFFGSSDLFSQYAKNYMNIVEYIMIWLSYMLNLKNDAPGLTNLEHFYKIYIEGGNNYKQTIKNVTEYTNYKDLIDTKKYYLKMDKNSISKLYNAFKLLCEMYTGFDRDKSNCTTSSEKADKFVKIYEELKKDFNITTNNSYNDVLCTLSADYDHFKNKFKNSKCSDTSFPEIKIPQNIIKCSEQKLKQISEDTSSSSSVTNKLLLVLSIFATIAIFLGIAYKYSLFGFRKRVQKQYLREKIKNIKKRMNQ